MFKILMIFFIHNKWGMEPTIIIAGQNDEHVD